MLPPADFPQHNVVVVVVVVVAAAAAAAAVRIMPTTRARNDHADYTNKNTNNGNRLLAIATEINTIATEITAMVRIVAEMMPVRVMTRPRSRRTTRWTGRLLEHWRAGVAQ